jgi:hypothetical protein
LEKIKQKTAMQRTANKNKPMKKGAEKNNTTA